MKLVCMCIHHIKCTGFMWIPFDQITIRSVQNPLLVLSQYDIPTGKQKLPSQVAKIWVFPKIGGFPQEWMVYDEESY